MASVKIPMDNIESIFSTGSDNGNSVCIQFKRTVEDDIPHVVHVGDSQYTIIIDGENLLIEK